MAKTIYQLFNTVEGLDEMSLKIMLESLTQKAKPSFDYIEFKQSVSKLMDLQLDETMAIKSAYATASTLGMTRESLIETAKYYQTQLEKEKGVFEEKVQTQQQKGIASRIEQVKALKDKIADWREEIAKLEGFIKNAESEIAAADAQIQDTSEKIDTARAKFDTTYKHVHAEIGADILKIQTIL